MSLRQQSGDNTSLRQQVLNFLRLGRPLHLAGGFVFNALGLTIARYLGTPINCYTAVCCQIAITSTQLMTHYSNEYFDQDADAANPTPTRWAGGSKILPAGLLPPRTALIAALLCGAIALLATAVLTTTVNTPILTLTLFLLAIFLAWNYSSPPLWLNRRGLGEITVTLLVPGLTTLLSFQVQNGALDLLPLLAVVPLCCLQLAMILAVNLPDAAGDALVNKRTLVVILGPIRAARLFLAALTLTYLLLPLLVLLGLPQQVAFAILLALPPAIWQAWRVRRSAAADPRQWNALAFWSIFLLIATALLETSAFIMLISWQL